MTLIDDIKKRVEAATPGPWVVIGKSTEGNPGCGISSQIGDGTSFRVANTDIDDLDCDAENSNAELIAHAPSDLRYLLGIAEAAQKGWEVLAILVESGECSPEAVALCPELKKMIIAEESALRAAIEGKGPL